MEELRQKLRDHFAARALQFGDFTLASGKKSNYYVNSKKVLFHSEPLFILGEILYFMTHPLKCQSLGGLEIGAIPMTAAALSAYARHEEAMEGFFVRKKAKDHGSKELLEGSVKPGDRVVVIDDVLTTGGSVLQAIAAVEAAGAEVAQVICICDRLQGAAQALKAYDFQPILTIRDFGLEPLPD